ncbi:glycosyltransferase family 2 protein [Leifsonia sp. YIM 134122]|uniref:4,4'-diaponeurosporenoate glycosyltransferase n=1 Tax=Leifsonia stereocauli TaxID=3134136 RepID=A0ABU9VZD3_9MICO
MTQLIPTTTDRPVLTVSIVIPVKDDARPLAVCLRALQAQTVAPFEIIVVDNGSTDDSGDVARSLGAVVVVESRPGIGMASATGYSAASGDIIARLDADSIPQSDWVATIADTFGRLEDVDAITGPAYFIDGPAWLRSPAAALYLGSYFLFTGMALGHVPLFGSNLALRRSTWASVRHEVHVHDQLTHDDLDLSFHVGVSNSIRFIPSLRSGISMRPLNDGKGSLRWKRGIHTVTMHWPHDLPWLRLGRRLMYRARNPAPVSPYRR